MENLPSQSLRKRLFIPYMAEFDLLFKIFREVQNKSMR